ncbi:ATP-dependent helicase [Geminocystis sp. NIES-3709]|uniref:ATP-dependent helicase n=1 Tax=Geminocystis sp. NIES-3709 TaxID=1617448 RepID=UPI0005FCD39B|nr:ATP-dependent helicase [Geminocystis sp. NIES-3709]BAQ63489.1 ATP-dependent DNA helicase UvrD/PcrA/Rep [Geminocystis sp. NIES-3709]
MVDDKIDRDLKNKILSLVANLREGQKQLALWKGGKMAVSAVPGAGKSHGLATAAAITIAKNKLHSNRQLIIVTYTRSATASIEKKVKEILTQELKLLPVGFSVQTIHSLAVNIANRYPQLSQLEMENRTLTDINSSHPLIFDTVNQWVKNHPELYELLLKGEKSLSDDESELLQRESILLNDILPKVAYNAISIIKSSDLTLNDSFYLPNNLSNPYPLMTIAKGLYEEYQELMIKQQRIDYDDLILSALRVLKHDRAREILQEEVFAVFEDEAQDSSPLQEKLLEILATDTQNNQTNFVRVGDSNQAINSTFTSADPKYFRDFCHQCQENNSFYTMNQAGRSCQIIIDTANKTLTWVNNKIKAELVNKKVDDISSLIPFENQEIKPVIIAENSTNINPQSEGKGLEIEYPKDIYQTVDLIKAKIIKLWDKKNKEKLENFAILVRENKQGKFLYDYLKDLEKTHNLKVKLISDTDSYAKIPQEILSLLQFLDSPHSSQYLRKTLEIVTERLNLNLEDITSLSIYPEKFLYPTLIDCPQNEQVIKIKNECIKLLQARLELAPYQLIIFLSLALKYDQLELATVQKLNERIKQEIKTNISLKSIIDTLKAIVNGEKFKGVEIEDEKSYQKEGQLTIITMHKAKGLEWDYVFLPFLHENIIPGNGEGYMPKNASFIGKFNLADVTRSILRSIVHHDKLDQKEMSIDEASLENNYQKKAEEYRLLYVAMTRAKKLLWMSSAKKAPWRWGFFEDNGNKSQLQDQAPCPVIIALS